MSTEIDFKTLWNNAAKAEVPDASELFKKGAQLQRKNRVRLLLCNILLAFTIVFIAWVWVHYQPQMLTTKVGIVLVISAIAFYLIATMGYINLLYKDNADSSVDQYLQHLLTIKQKQKVLSTIIMSTYFALLSAGLFLYMIEYVRRGSLTFQVLAYGITFGWIAFNWFYIRRRTIKKQSEKMDVIIGKLEEINGQLI